MRLLNQFTYVSTTVVSASYFLPERFDPVCAVAVFILGMVTVPIAERIRLRACEQAATVASQEGRRQLRDKALQYLDEHDQPVAGD